MKKSGLRFVSSKLNERKWLGPVKAGVIRKIKIPDSRYTMVYRTTSL
jgi:hypothetical protein